jgi:hypothetical protein
METDRRRVREGGREGRKNHNFSRQLVRGERGRRLSKRGENQREWGIVAHHQNRETRNLERERETERVEMRELEERHNVESYPPRAMNGTACLMTTFPSTEI